MLLALAVVVGAFFAAAVYLLLQRHPQRWLLGLILLGHGANLLVFSAARPESERPPIIPAGADKLEAPFSDPLPQALVLTAIVISFGIVAFALGLVFVSRRVAGIKDLDSMTESER